MTLAGEDDFARRCWRACDKDAVAVGRGNRRLSVWWGRDIGLALQAAGTASPKAAGQREC